MHVINSRYYGKVMQPLSKENTLEDEDDHFTHVKMEAMGRLHSLKRSRGEKDLHGLVGSFKTTNKTKQ